MVIITVLIISLPQRSKQLQQIFFNFQQSEHEFLRVKSWLIELIQQMNLAQLMTCYQRPTIIIWSLLILSQPIKGQFQQNEIILDIGLNISSHIVGFIFLFISQILYVQLDIRLQIAEEQRLFLESKLIKVIHDLQNPILVMNDTLEDKDVNQDKAIKIIKFEIIDLQEILDNIRTYFKWKNCSDFNESQENCNVVELVNKFTLCHDKISINGNNMFSVEVHPEFPIEISIQKLNVFRIVNTITANSLRQIKNGNLNIHIQIKTKDVIITNTNSYYEVGTINLDYNNQMEIEIKVSGFYLPLFNVDQIFDTKSNEFIDKWKNTTLNLEICSQILVKSNSFIRQFYKGEDNQMVQQVQIPFESKSKSVGNQITWNHYNSKNQQFNLSLNLKEDSKELTVQKNDEINILNVQNQSVKNINRDHCPKDQKSRIYDFKSLKLSDDHFDQSDFSYNYNSNKDVDFVINDISNNDNANKELNPQINEKITDNIISNTNQNEFQDNSIICNKECNYIQIAEDNFNILEKYEKNLTKNQIPFRSFLNGQLLYDHIVENVCMRCKCMLIQTDMNMPYLDGIELAKLLRSNHNIVQRIILITAEESDIQGKELFDSIYQKPIQIKKLREIYQDQIKNKTLSLNQN